MNPTQKVIKNSLWLIIQPLILNIISIFVIGYIARTLGQADYGKFVFAFTFVILFVPIGNMGLRTITVREIAENKANANVFLGKIVTLRFFFALIAFSLIIFIINLMHYPIPTKIVVYIAAVAMVLDIISTTFKDTFQAFEKMQYVAYTNFISGAILTALSVLVLFVGYRLIGLTLVYMFGSFLGVTVGGYFLFNKFAIPKPKIDFSFCKRALYKGAPFFYPTLIATIGLKLGIVLLSKIAGDVSVATYGAANNLVEKLLIIPDGLCTAFFPTMVVMYQASKNDASHLFQRFFLYLFLLGMPMAVGVTILARPIITLIYGSKYLGSILVLRIIIWYVFFNFLNLLFIYTLGATHQEKTLARIFFITTPCYIMLILFLIPHFKEVGVAVSDVVREFIFFVIMFIFIKRYLTIDNLLKNKICLKMLIANIIMAFFIFIFRDYNVFLSISLGIISYSFAILSFRVISIYDLLKLRKIVVNREELRGVT